MRRYIKELKPSTFPEIAAIVALYRPGPMEQIPTYIKAKHGLEPIHYPHPILATFSGRDLRGYCLSGAGAFHRAGDSAATVWGKRISSVRQWVKRFSR